MNITKNHQLNKESLKNCNNNGKNSLILEEKIKKPKKMKAK